MRHGHHFTSVVVCLSALSLRGGIFAADLPSPEFVEQEIGSNWNEPVGLAFTADGRKLFVWERPGRVWIVESGVKQPAPVIDISEEVGGWRDYGLLGVALHPDFLMNGFIYLLYVVDRHHLLHFGTGSYSPSQSEYNNATIGRLTRYTLSAADDFNSVEPDSRFVLIGESITTGFPILHQSHGTGQIVFGDDNTLLASCGDAASYSTTDTGGQVGGGWRDQALADGILKSKEDVGSYRAQLVDCLNGKIVRLDPFTGDGVPSNPFYDSADPRSARSRVWALGLRNPFRIFLRAGTGSHDPGAADPGSIYIGDVGWGTWEDLHVCTGPGQNFGWPAFEGLTVNSGYWSRNIENLDAPNPLYDGASCTQRYFYFRDLIQQDTLDPNPSFPNPCDPAVEITTAETFIHTRPSIDWRHGSQGPSRTGIFNGAAAAEINLDDGNSPVPGPNFGGNAAVAGVWYTGDDFPAQYRNTYFHGDFGARWIRSFVFDANDQPVEVKDLITGARVVFMGTHPLEGGLYYIDWDLSKVFKVSYLPSGNRPPIALASLDQAYGPSPHAVRFTGSNSSDPEQGPLTYEWDFGDTSPLSTEADPSHVFAAASGLPARYTVTLAVTDDAGETSVTTLLVSVNNTPPSVTITSPVDGALYSMTSQSVVDLRATITDAEHGPGQLRCEWRAYLRHNDHDHPEPPDPSCSTSAVIAPIGCDGNTYFYRIVCTVTDDAGLTGSDEVSLFPDCSGAGGGDFVADFEEHSPDWLLTGLWRHVEAGAGCGASASGHHSMYYGQEPACSYDVGATSGSLESPPIDLPAGTTPGLSFLHRFETESFAGGSFDRLFVQINDGAGWTTLESWDSTRPNLPTWTQQRYDVSSYAGSTVRIRFLFDSVDGEFNDYSGWYVDDVVVSGLSVEPRPPTAAFSASAVAGVAPLHVVFTDQSANAPTSWEWDFDGDGVIDSTARNPAHTYGAPGAYTVRLIAANSVGGDEEIKVDYIVVSAAAADWVDDMEGGVNGWTASGSWHQVSDPANCGVAARSGVTQWYYGRDAACDYATGARTTGDLVSPSLVLSDSGSELRFFHQFETESHPEPYDQLAVQVDKGSGWTTLASWDTSDPNLTEWTEQVVDLGAYRGSTVQIRFHFDSIDELFNEFRGWSIDDVSVSQVLSP